MSNLEELIERLCPDGVEYKELSEVLTIRNGKDYKHFGEGNVPVYGSGGIMTYIDTAVYEKPSVLIPRKGSLDKLYFVQEPFWTVDTIFYTDINVDIVEPKYIFYYLQKEHLEKLNKAGGVPSLTQSVLNKVKLPVPPLEVQREIVRILDNFAIATTEIQQKLQEELAARQKQYEYYRDLLLTFKPNESTILNERTNELELSGAIRWMKLGELCDYVDYRGKTPKKVDQGIFLVTAKNVRMGFIDYEKSKEYISKDDYLEVMRRGLPKIGDLLITTEAPCGNVALVDREDIALAQRIIKYRPKRENVNRNFLKHYLLSKEFQDVLQKNATGGTVKGIKGSKLHELNVPVPPLEVQQRIVDILDRFDTLCNDITSGLPAEIEMRQKQYEYYRDKLLTFKELKKEA